MSVNHNANDRGQASSRELNSWGSGGGTPRVPGWWLNAVIGYLGAYWLWIHGTGHTPSTHIHKPIGRQFLPKINFFSFCSASINLFLFRLPLLPHCLDSICAQSETFSFRFFLATTIFGPLLCPSEVTFEANLLNYPLWHCKFCLLNFWERRRIDSGTIHRRVRLENRFHLQYCLLQPLGFHLRFFFSFFFQSQYISIMHEKYLFAILSTPSQLKRLHRKSVQVSPA